MSNSIFDHIDKFLDKETLDLSKKRLGICQECEHFNSDTKRCSICSCFMEAKTRLRTAKCPMEKW